MRRKMGKEEFEEKEEGMQTLLFCVLIRYNINPNSELK